MWRGCCEKVLLGLSLISSQGKHTGRVLGPLHLLTYSSGTAFLRACTTCFLHAMTQLLSSSAVLPECVAFAEVSGSSSSEIIAQGRKSNCLLYACRKEGKEELLDDLWQEYQGASKKVRQTF